MESHLIEDFWFVGISTLHTGEYIQKLNSIDDSIAEEISIDDLINSLVCQFL